MVPNPFCDLNSSVDCKSEKSQWVHRTITFGIYSDVKILYRWAFWNVYIATSNEICLKYILSCLNLREGSWWVYYNPKNTQCLCYCDSIKFLFRWCNLIGLQGVNMKHENNVCNNNETKITKQIHSHRIPEDPFLYERLKFWFFCISQ
jgi:hypothetical protein